MSGGWQSQKLGSLAEFRNGVNFGREDEGIGTPIIKVKDFGDLHHVPIEGLDQLDQNRVRVPSNQFLKRNDILLVRSNGNPALVGRSMIFSGPDDAITFSGFSIRARVDSSKAAPAFIHYWLRSDFARSRFAREGNGTGIQNLSQGFLADLDILLPPLGEQRAIAATLGALDDKIEANRKMNATLEAMARALFRDWFVDFGPTRAKMEGHAHYLSPDLWSLFPDRLDDEDKPDGWEVRPLVDCFDLLMGQSPPGDTYNDSGDGLPFFQGRTDFGFRFPENRKFCSAPTRVAEKGDTLVSVRAPVGDINLASERCCIGRGVAALRHKEGWASFTYYTGWSLQEELRQYENTGTVFGAINKKQFEKLPTIDPGPAVIEVFEEAVSALDSRIDNNDREARTLAQTRDLLLPRLMSGELSVADLASSEQEAFA